MARPGRATAARIAARQPVLWPFRRTSGVRREESIAPVPLSAEELRDANRAMQLVRCGGKGFAVRAAEDIPQDTLIGVYADIALGAHQANMITTVAVFSHNFYDADTFLLNVPGNKEGCFVATCFPSPDNLCGMLNASCKPNCVLVNTLPSMGKRKRGSSQSYMQQLRLYAAEDIPAGAELTWDYAAVTENRWEAMECLCGEDCCTGTLVKYVPNTTPFEHYLGLVLCACASAARAAAARAVLLSEDDWDSLRSNGIRGALRKFEDGARLPIWLMKWCLLVCEGEREECMLKLLTALQSVRCFLEAQDCARTRPPYVHIGVIQRGAREGWTRFAHQPLYRKVCVTDVPRDARDAAAGTTHLVLDCTFVAATMCNMYCASTDINRDQYSEEIAVYASSTGDFHRIELAA